MDKISDLIKALVKIKNKEGDLDLVCYGEDFSLKYYSVSHLKVEKQVFILKKGGNKKIDIANRWDTDKKSAAKEGRILTNKKILKL